MTHRVYCQDWLESERGWGSRPDGHSLHLNKDHRDSFVAEFWSTMPNEVPDEYSRPLGELYEIRVPTDVYMQIRISKNGIRVYQLPKSGQ